MGKNVGKIISKNLISKYSQKRFDHAKQSPTASHENTLKKNGSKKATGDLSGIKIDNKIATASKTSPNT